MYLDMVFYTASFCAAVYLLVAVHAFAPSFLLHSTRMPNSIRNWKLYTEIEDTAETLHFASVGTKDHLGPDFPPSSLAPQEERKEWATEAHGSENETHASDTDADNLTRSDVKLSTKKNTNRQKNNKRKRKKNVPKKYNDKETPVLPLTDLKLGSTIEGRVAAFTEFGVFIRINYDLKGKGNSGYALLHKSQIRDEFVEDPSKLFRVGSLVQDLRVITINYEKGEVGLSLRTQRPQRKSLSEFEVGKEYTGKISNVVSYGAFVDLGAETGALLHISRITQKKIDNIQNWVNVGDTVTVRIIGKDETRKTMSASMLNPQADEYLDRRSAQLERLRQKSSNTKNEKKSELEYFEDAVKVLEDALK